MRITTYQKPVRVLSKVRNQSEEKHCGISGVKGKGKRKTQMSRIFKSKIKCLNSQGKRSSLTIAER